MFKSFFLYQLNMNGSKTIRTIIFDLAEVYLRGIVGVEVEIAKVLNVNEAEVVPIHLAGEKRDLLFRGKLSEDEYWQRVIEENNYPTSIKECGSTLHFLKCAIRRNFKEMHGTGRVIRSLKNSGYHLGLLSVHAKEWTEYCEERFPLAELFSVRCYSFQEGMTKEDPEFYNRILLRLNADPKTTLYIDNESKNLEISRSPTVGIGYTHKFTNVSSLKKELTRLGIEF
jgi:FMN phosphatase YigB (HAD superfamily)